jgi:hypothetical protein
MMDILITESQKKILMTEGIAEALSEIYSGTKDYSADLYKRVKKKLGSNLSILLTFSAAIGGVVEPLESFLRGKFPDLSEEQTLLILTAVVAILWKENTGLIRELVAKIKDEGLNSKFFLALTKANQLKKVFGKFLTNTLQGASGVLDILSYTYMIPILGYLVMMYQGQEISPEQAELLGTRLSAIVGLTVSSESIGKIVDTIRKKSKNL